MQSSMPADIFNNLTCPHQQTPKSESTLFISDGVLAVEATVSLPHCLHSHVPFSISTQGLHCSITAEDNRARRQHEQPDASDVEMFQPLWWFYDQQLWTPSFYVWASLNATYYNVASYLYAVLMPVMSILRFWPSSTVIIWDAGSKRNSFIMGLK